MNSQGLKAAQERVDAKLRYAHVMQADLRGMPRRGSDEERAHQEAFLFHLLGARDALLQELNIIYGLGMARKGVNIDSIRNGLAASGKSSVAFEQLLAIENDSSSWLNCAKDMRNHAAHRANVGRHFYQGGLKSGQVSLQDTRTGEEIDRDYLDLHDDWLAEMGRLVTDLRSLI